tara:strand:- start:467 stop:787 length:321 start_codon:yes stop_codon:yes gene_type:complete
MQIVPRDKNVTRHKEHVSHPVKTTVSVPQALYVQRKQEHAKDQPHNAARTAIADKDKSATPKPNSVVGQLLQCVVRTATANKGKSVTKQARYAEQTEQVARKTQTA